MRDLTIRRKEELEMLIGKTRDKLFDLSNTIKRMNYGKSYSDKSYLDAVTEYVERLKEYQSEYSKHHKS